MNSLNDGASKKVCTKCHKEKNLTDFHACKRTPSGRKSMCKQCHSEKYKGYRSPTQIQRQQECKRKKENIVAQLQSATHKECSKCNQLLPKESFKPRKTSIDGLNQQCRKCVNVMREKQRRSNGIKSRDREDEYKKLDILSSLLNEIDEAKFLAQKGNYYLGSLCPNNHDWHGTGYSLRYAKRTACVECNSSRHKSEEYKAKYRDKSRYVNWLKSPRISPSVAELVAKAQYQWNEKQNPELIEERKRKAREAYKKRYQENTEKEKLRIKKWKHANPHRIDKHNQKRIERVRSKSDGSITIDVVDAILKSAKQCIYCFCKLTPETATIDHIEPLSKGGLHSAFNLVACCRACNSKKHNKPFCVWLDELPESNKSKAEQLYRKRYGASPLQGVLPLVF